MTPGGDAGITGQQDVVAPGGDAGATNFMFDVNDDENKENKEPTSAAHNLFNINRSSRAPTGPDEDSVSCDSTIDVEEEFKLLLGNLGLQKKTRKIVYMNGITSWDDLMSADYEGVEAISELTSSQKTILCVYIHWVRYYADVETCRSFMQSLCQPDKLGMRVARQDYELRVRTGTLGRRGAGADIADEDFIFYDSPEYIDKSEQKPTLGGHKANMARGLYNPWADSNITQGHPTSGKSFKERFRKGRDAPKFMGRHSYWMTWKKLFTAYLGSNGLKHLIAREEEFNPKVDPEYQEKNEWLFDTLVQCTIGGEASAPVEGDLDGEGHTVTDSDGRAAWLRLVEWYEGSTVSKVLATRTRKSIDSHKLLPNGQIGDYIKKMSDDFKLLASLKEGYTTATRKEKFLAGIQDPRLAVVKKMCELNNDLSVRDTMMAIKGQDLAPSSAPRKGGANVATRYKARTKKSFARKSKSKSRRANKAAATGNEDSEVYPERRMNRSAGASQGTNQSTQRTDRTNNSTRGSGSSNIRCYDCGEVGHIAVNCPRRQGNDTRGANRRSDGDGANRGSTTRNARFGRRAYRSKGGLSSATVLTDSCCDTCLVGEGFVVLEETKRWATIQAYNYQTERYKIVSAGAKATGSDGTEMIVVFHESAHRGTGVSLLSNVQAGANGVRVEDAVFFGPKRITGYLDDGRQAEIQLTINQGACEFTVQEPTKYELETLPRLNVTSIEPWDPGAVSEEYVLGNTDMEALMAEELRNVMQISATHNTLQPKEIREYFLNAPKRVLEKTLEVTTCLGTVDTRIPLRRHFRSRFPHLNVNRIKERVDTDTIYPRQNVKHLHGYTCSQLFVGAKSSYMYLKIMRKESEGPDALQDYITDVGAPKSIHSDRSKMQLGKRFSKICKDLYIKRTTTEAYHPWQNKAERVVQELNRNAEMMMRMSGAPANVCLYALRHTVEIMNYTARESLSWKTPFEMVHGSTPDITALIQFSFWEKVFYLDPTEKYPSSREKSGRFLGIATNIGDPLTYYILTTDLEVLARSAVRKVEGGDNPREWLLYQPNKLEGGAEDPDGDDWTIVSKDWSFQELGESQALDRLPDESGGNEHKDSEGGLFPTLGFGKGEDEESDEPSPADKDTEEDQVSEGGDTSNISMADTEEEKDELDEAAFYDAEDAPHFYTEKIVNHKFVGPLKKLIKLKVQWRDGSTSWEPMKVIRADDPDSVAEYAQDRNLVGKRGFKWVEQYLSERKPRSIQFIRVNKTKKKTFKYGVVVPRSIQEALFLDKENGNHLWSEAIQREIAALKEFKVFKALKKLDIMGERYQKVPLLWVFDVKPADTDGNYKRKARLVAGGHVTNPQGVNLSSTVVKSESVRAIYLAATLNKQKMLMGDIKNAYVQAYTREKVYGQAGEEWGSLRGMYLIVLKALYGLKSASSCWWSMFADFLRAIGFIQSYGDSDTWYREDEKHPTGAYEYLCVHVDDFIIVATEPWATMKTIQQRFTVSNPEEPRFYLGADVFVRNGFRHMGSRTYVRECITKVEKEVGKLHKERTPLGVKDTLHEDDSPLLPIEGHRQYQKYMGMLVWCVSLGRIDIAYAVNELGRYSASPREGHLMRVLRVFRYLKRFPDSAVCFDIRMPDDEEHRKIDGTKQEIFKEYYPDAEDVLPTHMPEPKGMEVRLTVYVDANHAPDPTTRRSVTGYLIYINSTPIYWTSKRQRSVETSTYGSELVALKMAVERAEAELYNLRMMGMRVVLPIVTYCDNKSVVDNCSVPESRLKKKHLGCAYHKIRELIAAGIIQLVFKAGKENRSDMLTRPLSGPALRADASRVITINLGPG